MKIKALIGHFRVPKTLTFKKRLSAKPFLSKWVLLNENRDRPFLSCQTLPVQVRLSAMPWIWKWVFILMDVKFIFTRKVLSVTSFWKWECLKLGNGFALSLALKQRLGVTRTWPVYVSAQRRVWTNHDWFGCWIGVFEEMCHERIFPLVQCNILNLRHHREDYL